MSDVATIEGYLEVYGELTYTNVGTSMLPLLRQGRDLFTVAARGRERCRVGDVVLYRRPPDRHVLHRVVGVGPGGYAILGDNCLAREWVPEEDVIAVMTSFVRDGREHGVDSPGYRAYTWVWLRTERPRVALRRALAKVRHAVRSVVGRSASPSDNR